MTDTLTPNPDVQAGWWVGNPPPVLTWTVLVIAGGSSLSGQYPGTLDEACDAALAAFRDGWADPRRSTLIEATPIPLPTCLPWPAGTVQIRRIPAQEATP